MKTLVTGGAGFIGSHVAQNLFEMGHEVVVLDDLSGGFRENISNGCKFIKGDICDVELVEELFKKENFEIVYHLAAYAAEGLSHFIRRFNYTNNLLGSVNLINASIKTNVKRFVFTSSIAVYGKNQLPMSEELAPFPEDPYGIAKLAIEQDLKSAFDMFGLEYVIFRPHNVYGERQNIGDPYRNVVGIFMNCILQDLPLPIFGDGSQTRAFSYIGDVAPTIAQSGFEQKAKNEIFNIGADQPISVLALAKHICSSLGYKNNFDFLPARNEVLHAFSTHNKVNGVFKNTKNTSLEEGINCMSKWVKDIGTRTSKRFENIEIYKNIPEIWGDIKKN